jgi:hypothetical protein
MTPYIVGAVIAQAVISGGLCAYLAEQKGYSTKAWFFVGLFLGVLGLIACAGLPVVNESKGSRESLAVEASRRVTWENSKRLRDESDKSSTGKDREDILNRMAKW